MKIKSVKVVKDADVCVQILRNQHQSFRPTEMHVAVLGKAFKRTSGVGSLLAGRKTRLYQETSAERGAKSLIEPVETMRFVTSVKEVDAHFV